MMVEGSFHLAMPTMGIWLAVCYFCLGALPSRLRSFLFGKGQLRYSALLITAAER